MSKQEQPGQHVTVIAVDGPSGSGKGTICRLLAQRTGFRLLDSGALYRLTALAAMNRQIDITSEAAVAAVAAQLDVVFTTTPTGILILLADEDVTQAIREEAVGMNASKVAAYPEVRQALLERQRAFAKAPGLIADGRDMGTVVFPEAEVKIFLTASAQERANRRIKQLEGAGVAADPEQILNDIRARDQRDANRAVAPLVPADDALELDSTALSIEQVVDKVFAEVKARTGQIF